MRCGATRRQGTWRAAQPPLSAPPPLPPPAPEYPSMSVTATLMPHHPHPPPPPAPARTRVAFNVGHDDAHAPRLGHAQRALAHGLERAHGLAGTPAAEVVADKDKPQPREAAQNGYNRHLAQAQRVALDAVEDGHVDRRVARDAREVGGGPQPAQAAVARGLEALRRRRRRRGAWLRWRVWSTACPLPPGNGRQRLHSTTHRWAMPCNGRLPPVPPAWLQLQVPNQ